MSRKLISFLTLLTLLVCPQISHAEPLGPGNYYGVVVFDRWDGCILYRGVYVTYISEGAKEHLRKYAGELVQINATKVYQPINPGDGVIKELEYLGAPTQKPEKFGIDGVRLRSFHAFKDGEKPSVIMEILNAGKEHREILSGELAPTLLTKQPPDPRPLSPSDGPSVALLTRMSIENIVRYGGKGRGVAQAIPYSWAIPQEDALPREFVLRPGEKKQIRMTFDLPEGEYEFLCGYGGAQYGRKCIASNLVYFDVGKDGSGKTVEGSPEIVHGLALHVMSFNIRYGTANDGQNRWENRRELVFDVLRKHRPDVVGLQEALRFQIDEIRQALVEYDEIGVGRDDGKTKGEYCAILYCRDRFGVDESGTFWLSDTPEVAGSITWGNACTRICTWARLVEKESRRAFYVFNLHLDHVSQPSREKSVVLITQRIMNRKHPDTFVVTGDFNAGENNPAILYLKGKSPLGDGYGDKSKSPAATVDTFRVLHPDATEVGTFNGFRGNRKGEKIDFVFATSDAQVLEAQILHDNIDGRYPSDHFPVTARLRLPAPSESR